MNDRDLAYHGLAIKRYATPEAVADLILRDPAGVVGLLDEAVATGRALRDRGNWAIIRKPDSRFLDDQVCVRFGRGGFLPG